MATQEQAKKEIATALRALRGILTQGPKQRYPEGLYQHPKVKKLVAEIEKALAPHVEALDPDGPYFRDFLKCDVLLLTQLPADWETLKWLDHYIERFGGTAPADPIAPWYHTPDEPKPVQFYLGPLRGTAKALDVAISGVVKTNERCVELKTQGREGRLWIVRHQTRRFAVFFSVEDDYTTAKQRLENTTETSQNTPQKSISRTSRKRN